MGFGETMKKKYVVWIDKGKHRFKRYEIVKANNKQEAINEVYYGIVNGKSMKFGWWHSLSHFPHLEGLKVSHIDAQLFSKFNKFYINEKYPTKR